MTDNKLNAIKNLSNVQNAVSNLMKALVDNDKDDIVYWHKSIQDWKNFLDKEIIRILKEMEKEEENPLEEEKVNE